MLSLPEREAKRQGGTKMKAETENRHIRYLSLTRKPRPMGRLDLSNHERDGLAVAGNDGRSRSERCSDQPRNPVSKKSPGFEKAPGSFAKSRPRKGLVT